MWIRGEFFEEQRRDRRRIRVGARWNVYVKGGGHVFSGPGVLEWERRGRASSRNNVCILVFMLTSAVKQQWTSHCCMQKGGVRSRPFACK